jgi:Glycosyltransferase
MLDVTLLVSHFCAERMRVVNGLPVAPPRYNVLYNPVDTDAFARFCPDPATRDYTRPVYGRLSRADPGKWSALALESLPLVREAVPDFLFLVVGGTDQARTYVAEHGLDNHVRFLPPVLSDQELAEFFNTLRFMAHANDTGESFGLVIAEAMAAGLPVVTHACPGWKDNAQLELVRHEETGLVADSVRSYADAIIRLLRDPGECRRMGAAGRKRAQKLFRAQTIARQLGAVYEEALGLKPPNVPVEGRP